MVNFGFLITARNSSSQERVLKVNINEWHDLLFTLCPNFAGNTGGFNFNREDVLSEDEIQMLEKISYDEEAVSVSEGYEELKEPNFDWAYKWINLFKKIETEFFKIENERFIKSIKESQNDEAEISKVINKIRISQINFDQIKQTLNVANENKLEVAFTISDY